MTKRDLIIRTSWTSTTSVRTSYTPSETHSLPMLTFGIDAALSGIVDPRVLVTTSRSPSSRLAAFSKEIRLLMPTAIRLNRGNTILPELVRSCNSRGLSDVVLLHEHRGTPTAMTVSHLPHGPTVSFSLHNVVLRQDIPNSLRGTVSESYPHLIFEVSFWDLSSASSRQQDVTCKRMCRQCVRYRDCARTYGHLIC